LELMATGEYKGKSVSCDSVKGKVNFQGIDVHLDRPKGFIMRGTDKEGQAWEREYKFDYGFIPKTLGGDHDGLDVFIGPDSSADESYWATQRKPDGSFDEYKVFLGFPSLSDAKKAYTDHIPKEFLGGWSTLSVDMMKAMLGTEPEGVKKLAQHASMLQELQAIRESEPVAAAQEKVLELRDKVVPFTPRGLGERLKVLVGL
jgi:hypothetical protein